MRSFRSLLPGAVLIWTAALFIVAASAADVAHADYSMPSSHPRIFFNQSNFAAIADRCKSGGTHRDYYLKLKGFADWRINAGSTTSYYLPNYALVYKIHKQWNDEGYQGGGFATTYYSNAVKQGLLNVSAYAQDGSGAEYSMAADWIWEQLSSSEIASIAGKYGSPDTNIYDAQTWRGGSSFKVCTSMFRSLLFAGSSVDGGNYSTEYQEICNYLESVYTRALNLAGGVGWNGANYATGNGYIRAWAIEAFTAATGVDGWALSGRWGDEHATWLEHGLVPHRDIIEANQDYNVTIWGDHYKNVALIAWRTRSRYNQRHTVKSYETILGRDISSYKNSALWAYTLFYDPTLSPIDPSEMPNAIRLGEGGMDHVYMTSGFGDGKAATWASFEAGWLFYGHQHSDAGSFTINRKNNLIIDSGYYGQYRATSGGPHAKNYYHRSVAHNCISVYDEGEDFYWGAEGIGVGPIANDGGQILPSSGPTYNQVLTDSSYHAGHILAYESNDQYTYARANLLNAYDYEAFADSRNLPFHANKLSHMTREFVYLRPDYFVVFDRVTSTNAAFSKVWNLHLTAEPEIFGSGGVQRMGDSEAGIWDYTGASLAKVKEYGTEGSVLFLKALLPKSRTIRKIGGRNRSHSGYAYWVGGFDGNGKYDPTRGANYYWGDWTSGNEYNEDFLQSSRSTPGWGRIEVEATSPALADHFLNVLYTLDGTEENIPETNLIETPHMTGAEIVNERVTLFGKSELTGIDSVTYEVAGHDTAALHMICNLTPATTFHIYREGATLYIRRDGMAAPQGTTELITPPPSSSASGVLAFHDDGTAYGPPPAPIEITGVSALFTGYEAFSVTITWTTDVASDSRVEYGNTTSYGSTSYLDPALVKNHSITLTEPDVLNDETYHFRAISEAPGSDSAVSQDYQFVFDVDPPGKVNDLRENSQ